MSDSPIPIIISSAEDEQLARRVQQALGSFGLRGELRAASTFQSPGHLLTMLTQYEKDPQVKLYIAAGKYSQALAALIDSIVTRPVIACPAPGYNSMPLPEEAGCAVASSPVGAAVMAAKIIGLADHALAERVAQWHRQRTERLVNEDANLRAG